MACIIIAVIAIPLICLMAGLLMYNGLVQKRNMVDNAFSSVDVNLKKRADLVPNLVATVKGYASHERQLFESVTRLRLEIHSSTSDDQRFDLEKQLGSQMNRLFALAESYPELKSSEGFLNLQRNLTELEEQISAARRAMNA
ncbi:MAG: LemA family protein, partial [Planctomycetota bacterium]